jgi:Carboxypeptidase regulatory-like domain
MICVGPLGDNFCGAWSILRLALIVFGGFLGCVAVSAQEPVVPPSIATQPPAVSSIGSVSGTVVDVDGALIAGAHVTLTSEGSPAQRLAVVDSQGHFSFDGVPAGKFDLTITADGMASASASGVLHAGEHFEVPQVTLRVATANTDVEVTLSRQELAETEIKGEEKQRLFGFAPNFYVSYDWHAQPLTPRQKWELAGKTMIDPLSFVITGGFAGVEQAENTFAGYGQGAQGYAKRYGASYANLAVGTTLGGAVLPILFHQDPRYFYKGTGSKRSRALYALSTAVIARGDNGKWQPAYAGILGDLGAGAISNIYYPASDRQGASLTLGNGFLGIAFDGVGNLLQEFVFRKMSSGAAKP